MTISLKGLTWDHPRAVLPLIATMEPMRIALPSISIQWDRQPLADFESRPLTETAKLYDLIVFDHPHVGEVASDSIFVPLDPMLRDAGYSVRNFVGPSLDSYRFDGQLWGLPLDAACQVSCCRPETFAALGLAHPNNWDELVEFGHKAMRSGHRLAIAYGGVHSLMVLLTLCANQGFPLISTASTQLGEREPALRALLAMRELLALCPPEVLGWNSIDALNAMSSRDDLVYCPVIYGFSPYAKIGSRGRLEFRDLVGLRAGAGGSTLGGAGIGISAQSSDSAAAFMVAQYLVDARTQTSIIAPNSGQPARVETWDSDNVNADSGGFYQNTRRTIEQAWVRPRFDGYMKFQRVGSSVVELYLRGAYSAEKTLDQLQSAWASCRA